MMKLGIIQGRLSAPTEGFQECPRLWQREFFHLLSLELDHIEWIITKNSFNTNPFFSYDLSGYPIHAVCADNLVDERIDNLNFMEENLDPICKAAVANDVEFVTIPLLESSSVVNADKRAAFKQVLTRFTTKYPGLKFSLEAELEAEKLLELLTDDESVYITYDTGNITSCGFNHEEYIRLLSDRFSNVHLKDRTLDAKTVPPGTGDTNFRLIFDSLRSVNYSGVFTMQTARECEGEELQTVARHMNILRRINEQLI
jgi:hexulose-6-phosphate isomerase